MKSDRTIFREVLAECLKYYKVVMKHYPNQREKIPNGYAYLTRRVIFLRVKHKNRLYAKQAAVLIHEFGHIQDHVQRMNSLSPLIPTNYELEERAWETGEKHFSCKGLIPKGFFEFREHCLGSHRRHQHH